MFGDGSSGRDYTFISDVVAGVLAAIECPRRYEIINVGSSRPVLLCELIAELGRLLGRHPRIEQAGFQAGDVSITKADISKAATLLGYRPQVSFREGLQRYGNWFEARVSSQRIPASPLPVCDALALRGVDR